MGLGGAGAAILVGAVASAATACSPTNYTTARHNDDGGVINDDPGDPNLGPPRQPDYENNDSGAFDLGGHKSDGGHVATDAGRTTTDAGLPPSDGGVPPKDGGGGTTPTMCPGPLAAGDVKIVEIMISSVSGSGDKGEWVEIQSTHSDCSLALKGLVIDSPRGDAGFDSATITDNLILAPNDTFIVADSSDTTINGHLASPVYTWNSSDVLKNGGDTVEVKMGTTVIDSRTYPNFTNLSLNVGRSVSFPVDCAWSQRDDWANWSYSFDIYSSTLEGTPNADNDDVTCPF